MLALYFVIVALVVAVDQITKYIVVSNVKPQGSVGFIPHVLDFVYSENRGVAFGMFQDATWLFVVLTSIVIVAFLILLIKNYKTSKLFSIASALIIGGGIGNLIDRIRLGYVVDFLQLSFFNPICNLADYAITFGTVLLIVYLLFFYRPKKTKTLNDEKA
ncbi:MAG: signal peptidase II [Ruminococcus sp.]|nr:signal peptidase II [Ruminococcus sp.]